MCSLKFNQVGNLSGGERNRVQLAKLLKAGGNMIILDEPSNDLDVEVLRSLEEALLNFAGSALVVSHDRYMLNRLCTHSKFYLISMSYRTILPSVY